MIKNVKIGKIYTRCYQLDDGQGFYDIVTQYVMIVKKDKHFEESESNIYYLHDIQDQESTWWEYEDVLKEELDELQN